MRSFMAAEAETTDIPLFDSVDTWYAPVGLSGWSGVGKDAIGLHLTEYGFQRVAFGDKIRELLYTLDPYIQSTATPLRQLVDAWGWDAAKALDEVRALLQNAAGAREIIAPDVWLRAANLLEACRKGRVVVTDVRFPDEAHYIKSLGGHVIRIDREGVDGPKLGHSSDSALDEWRFDAHFVNFSGTRRGDELRPAALARVIAESPVYGQPTHGKSWSA